MSDSDVDSSSLPPPPPPLPHSNSPKAHGSKTKGSPFEGAIQLPIRPSSTTSGRSQAPLTQPSSNSSPVPLSRSSQWNPSSEPSTPPITDAFDPIYGRRRRRFKRWLVGSLTTIAVVIAVVFGLYLVGQRRIFLKHIQEHQHHNETLESGNESLVKSPDLERGEDIQTTHTSQPTETTNKEGVPENNLNASTPASTKTEPTSTDSVLSTHDDSADLGTQEKLDLSSNNISKQTETSNPEEVPEKPSDEDNLVTLPGGLNAGTQPIHKTSKLPSSKLQGDLMEALMEGNHKTVNQLKRASPNHELTPEEIALLARGEPLPDLKAHSSEEGEEYSEEEHLTEPVEPQPPDDFLQQSTENTKEVETEAQEYPVGSSVENPRYGVLQPSSRDVQEVQILGNEETQLQTNHLHLSSQESAEQPSESQELPVEPQTNHLQHLSSQESAEQPVESQELPVEPQTNHLQHLSSQESAKQPIESQDLPVEPQTNHLQHLSSQESAEQPIESQELPVEPQTNHLQHLSSQKSAEQPIESQELPVEPQTNHLQHLSSQESAEQPIESQELPVEPQTNHLQHLSSQESAEQPIESQELPVEPQTSHLQYLSSQESAEQPIESQELPVEYSPEEPVEQEHNFGDNPENRDGFFPAEHELSFEDNPEQPSEAPEHPAEYISPEPIEQEHPFGNFRDQEVGTQEHAVGHIPSEHRLPFENTQEQSFGIQEYPAGSFPEQSPEKREYPAFGNNMGQPSEEKDFPFGHSSERAFENEEHSESIQEQPAELHQYPLGKTYRQSDEIEGSIHGSPKALEPASLYPDVGVQPGHMEGNSPNMASLPNSPEYSLIRQTDAVIDGSKDEYLEEQSSPFVRDSYQPSGAFIENAVPSTGEIFTNEIDSPIMTVNLLHFPEQDFVQTPVFVDPYYTQYVPQEASSIIHNEFDPYQNNVSEPSTVERFDELPAEPVDALYAYPQGGQPSPLSDEERLQSPAELILQEVDEGHLPLELSPDVNVPHFFEGPLLVDDSQELIGSYMASGETSHEELEDEGTVGNQEVPDGASDKLAFSEGPSVFNEESPINQYPETRSVPVLAGKLNGEFAGSLDEDDELRTAGLRRSIGSEGPYSPLQPRLLSKFSLREGPPVLLPHNRLPNKIPTPVPSSLLLPEGTIATPAVILEALPAILQQSVKQAGLSSPVSSNPIQIAPGSAQNPISEILPIPLTNLPNQVVPQMLAGVHPSGQLIPFPYPFNNNPSILANNIVPFPENTPHGVSYLKNPNPLVPNPNLPLHSVPFHLNPPANPWYHLLRSGQPHIVLPPHENLPNELPPHENLPDELPCNKNLPDELPCNKNLPDKLSHPQNPPLQSPHPPKPPSQILIQHQPLNPAHPSQQLLHAEKVSYHLINPHHQNPHLVGPSKFPPNIPHQSLPSRGPSKHNAHSRPPLHPAQTIRNLHSRVVPINYPNVRHIPGNIFTPLEREKAHEHVPHHARNPPWLQSIVLPPTVDTSVLKALQKLDNLNALNNASSVIDSDTLYPSDESSIKYSPLNAHLHGDKHTPLFTPKTSQGKPLALTPSASNYGIYHADESSLKHPSLHALPHNEKHKPLPTPEIPHQPKSFAPSERLYPSDKNSVIYPPPQAFSHGQKHTPILLPQNLHHPKTPPAPIVPRAELPHPADKNPIIHPSTDAFLHGDKHKPVFSPQTSHKINTLPFATHSETSCPTDKSLVKYPPLNAFLHDEKQPSPSSPQTTHTLIEPLPSKSILSSPVAVEAVSPVEMLHSRAHLNHLPHPPFKNFGIKPLAFNEAQQPPSSPLAVFEAKQAFRLPSAGYAAKQPLPFPLPPFHDTKQPPSSPWHIYYTKESPPSFLPPYDVKQLSSLPLATYETNQPPPSSLHFYDTKQPSPSPWHIYYAKQPSPSPLPVNDGKQPSPLPLATYDTKQPPSLPWPVCDAKQFPPLPFPAKQRSPLSLVFYGAKQAPPVPLPVYDAPQPLALYGANQYPPFSVSSQYTPLSSPDDENIPRPASVDHLARPDVAALLKSNDQLGFERLAALSEPEGILSPCSDEGSSKEPPKPATMLVSSQPIDKITKPVHPNGKPALPVEYLPGPYAWKDKNIVYSSNFPDLPIPAVMSNAPSESPDPSSPIATSFGPSSVLSHVVESVPFTWVQPISRVPNQN